MLQLVLSIALSLGLYAPQECGFKSAPMHVDPPPPDSGKPIIRN